MPGEQAFAAIRRMQGHFRRMQGQPVFRLAESYCAAKHLGNSIAAHWSSEKMAGPQPTCSALQGRRT